ncbi:hypothetical protein TTHERM_000723359 (macronuclear) [Tetrahymena thermophila SB210]|uniref:Uncharacterized protein n=1 Tax=Tetrahymena thermophila (strain SB210) TaxID=312017 RepID=W7XFS5_TETTS|nr:hypothetical protein TTHERM_000723359 [Tetrahymena thermophila SB210]EWS71674.1 hypothetical protein TTHERM_000723359 [Tetrahymena thermophila SB210]|eukprot:XP_012655785.1 hypothetical protein TTHERM_000723359 [Tetrahymena thermophila SB210]
MLNIQNQNPTHNQFHQNQFCGVFFKNKKLAYPFKKVSIVYSRYRELCLFPNISNISIDRLRSLKKTQKKKLEINTIHEMQDRKQGKTEINRQDIEAKMKNQKIAKNQKDNNYQKKKEERRIQKQKIKFKQVKNLKQNQINQERKKERKKEINKQINKQTIKQQINKKINKNIKNFKYQLNFNQLQLHAVLLAFNFNFCYQFIKIQQTKINIDKIIKFMIFTLQNYCYKF